MSTNDWQPGERGQIVPGLGKPAAELELVPLAACSDGVFQPGCEGVVSVSGTRDGKVEFIAWSEHTLGYVASALGYPAYYPVHAVALERPVKAVLMDLDGTSVRSEGFWVAMIEAAMQGLLDDPQFRLSADDAPYVQGHSVSEHLQYCIERYAPGRKLEDARAFYFEHTRRELRAIAEEGGQSPAFAPSPGLREFLLGLKKRGIKIGLVTSGLYEKAWPEILSAFRAMDLGDPREFYDAIITAGFPLGQGSVGTLGELSPKPHPWLYAEVCRSGLGIDFADRNSVVGIEDSGAGVCSIRLAGFPTIGFGGGNIIESGTRGLCDYYCETFEEVMAAIDG